MTPPPGAGPLVHEALLYRSDDQFLDVTVPFLQDAAERGEPALVALGPATRRLLRSAGDLSPAVRFIGYDGRHPRPATVIRTLREEFEDAVADGATRIRMLGEIPHPGTGEPWDGWARYEATMNHTFAHLPVWGICPYDVRTTPPSVLDDVLRTHPFVHRGQGHVPNPAFLAPENFLARHRTPEPEWRLPTGAPSADLPDPTPSAARDAVHALTARTMLSGDDVDDLVMAVSEAVSNGRTHGVAPVRLRLWAEPDRVLAAVDDRGSGPTDPYAGLLATRDTTSAGLGLWLIHQICTQVSLGEADGGFRVRLVIGRPDRVGGAHG